MPQSCLLAELQAILPPDLFAAAQARYSCSVAQHHMSVGPCKALGSASDRPAAVKMPTLANRRSSRYSAEACLNQHLNGVGTILEQISQPQLSGNVDRLRNL